jgi:hypothetical protein
MKIGVKKAAIVKETNNQKKIFSFVSSMNLFKYCVENKSDVLCKINVEKENIIAIDAPIIPATAKEILCKFVFEIVKL